MCFLLEQLGRRQDRGLKAQRSQHGRGCGGLPVLRFTTSQGSLGIWSVDLEAAPGEKVPGQRGTWCPEVLTGTNEFRQVLTPREELVRPLGAPCPGPGRGPVLLLGKAGKLLAAPAGPGPGGPSPMTSPSPHLPISPLVTSMLGVSSVTSPCCPGAVGTVSGHRSFLFLCRNCFLLRFILFYLKGRVTKREMQRESCIN